MGKSAWKDSINKFEKSNFFYFVINDTINLPIQINGKLRATIEITVDEDEEVIKNAVHEAVKDKLEGQNIVKEIYVKNKIYNVVVK